MQTKLKVHTQYKDSKGNRLPSVTTVLNILAKPALLEWAWKCGCDGLDYKAVRDQAGDIGSLAHYLIMCDIKGEMPDISEYSPQDVDKAETCLLKYWDWRKTNPISPILTEESLISEQYRYGGTLDCFAERQDTHEFVLIDFKTGKAIYDEAIMQVVSYQRLLEENGYKVDAIKILRIGRDENEGFEERVIYNSDVAWQIFLRCLDIYNLKKALKS